MAEETTALLLRVQEWAAWLALTPDPQMNQLQAIGGETGIEVQEGESLVDIEVVTTNQTRTLPIPATEDEPAKNVRVKLVVFRATLARRVKGEIPVEDTPPPDKPEGLIMTDRNRSSQRRKRKH